MRRLHKGCARDCPLTRQGRLRESKQVTEELRTLAAACEQVAHSAMSAALTIELGD